MTKLGNQCLAGAGRAGEQNEGMAVIDADADFYQGLFILPGAVKEIRIQGVFKGILSEPEVFRPAG
jgi:hypothetical protein